MSGLHTFGRANLAGCGGTGIRVKGRAAQLFASVLAQPSQKVRAYRNNAGGINVLVNDVVVFLDLLEVYGVTKAGSLEEVACVPPQIGHGCDGLRPHLKWP